MAGRLFFRTTSGRTAFVNTGFSWAAFFFGPLWAVAKRQWVLFALLCVTEIPLAAISMLAELRGDDGLLALSGLAAVAYMVIYGALANRWHRYFLERQGYVFEGFAP